MTPIGDIKIQRQPPTIALFRDRLGDEYLGDLHEREEARLLAHRAGSGGGEMWAPKP